MCYNCPVRKILLLFLALAVFLSSPHPGALALICEVDAPPVLSITDEVGPFTLTFNDFTKDTLSTTQSVDYRIQANTMASGTVQNALSARLDNLFSNADLEGDVQGYTNLGNSDFARLVEAQSGFVVIKTSDTRLADKTGGQGHGRRCLDGKLSILWRSKLTQEAPAGTQSNLLIVTLRDGL